MVRKLFTLFCASVISFSLTTVVSGQETAAPEKKMDKAAKEVRWEGNVIRSDPGQSTLTIRQVGSNAEMTAHYDSSTRWVSQYHGDKKVNDIDASQVKDGDRVIVMGNYEKHVVGSRTGAMLRRFGLSVAPRFLWECLNSQTVSSFPVPASSNPSCRFPAMGLPVCFLSRIM